jgi:hypothetical protein
MTRIIQTIKTPGDQPWTNDQLEVIEAVAQVIFEPGEFSENALADLLWRHVEGNRRGWTDDHCTDAAYVLGGVAKVLAERQAEHVANLTEPGQEPTADQIEAVTEDRWLVEVVEPWSASPRKLTHNTLPQVPATQAMTATAYEWHGGQFSPLYSFASTGGKVHTEAHREKLLAEIDECLDKFGQPETMTAPEKRDRAALVELEDHVSMVWTEKRRASS